MCLACCSSLKQRFLGRKARIPREHMCRMPTFSKTRFFIPLSYTKAFSEVEALQMHWHFCTNFHNNQIVNILAHAICLDTSFVSLTEYLSQETPTLQLTCCSCRSVTLERSSRLKDAQAGWKILLKDGWSWGSLRRCLHILQGHNCCTYIKQKPIASSWFLIQLTKEKRKWLHFHQITL